MSGPPAFVDDWNIIEILGEGAYGEVKLLMHRVSGDTIALKSVDIHKHQDALDCVTKEERIHRILVHPNIIRMYGKRQEPDMVYLFLEYASGGELFNKIEPDIGMTSAEAQKYMKQLLSGVQYLHGKGIVHRDLKPENLLLDEHSNLKISDFGLATIFRLRGRERLLDKRCGTLPYVAPEVLQEPYRAEPADIWSCGIIFVAMLAGELPWDEPTEICQEYLKWKVDNGLLTTPWSKLEMVALGLARKLLSFDPSQRPKIEQILQHPWMKTEFSNARHEVCTDSSDEPPAKRRSCETDENETYSKTLALSQPTPSVTCLCPNVLASLMQQTCLGPKRVCFSQPTNNEDLILCSQIQFTQSPINHTNFQRLIKRMTRFFVKSTYEDTITSLCAALDKLHYSWTSDASCVVTISTMDSRKMKLVFKANMINMNNKLLLDFRLSKGCGLEFKKRFLKLQLLLSDIILND